MALQQGEYQAGRKQDEINRTIGSQIAMTAGSGIGLDGSPSDAIASTFSEGALDTGALRCGSSLEASFEHTERILTLETLTKYKFSNERKSKIIAIIEPWAEEFDLPANSILEIDILSERHGSVETELTERYLVVELWGGCRVEVLIDGITQDRSSLNIPSFG